MPSINPETYHLSASSIAVFLRCPVAFRLSYREGIRLAEDTESQRVGTGYHGMFEAYGNAEGDHEAKVAAGIEYLNERYKNCPAHFDFNAWAVERQVLFTAFHAYWWYWQNDSVEILESEIAFNLPIHAPKVGLPLPMDKVQRVGKIDHLVKWQGAVCCLERKTTARSIAPDSVYWEKWRKDKQVSMYALAFQDLRATDEKIQTLIAGADRFGSTLVDVFAKPKTKPAMLTQKETAEFIASGMYQEQTFEVSVTYHPDPIAEKEEGHTVVVNGYEADVEMGKKGFAIRETVEMYGARLLQEMYATPEKFFQRREIVRTDAELTKFRKSLYSIYQTQRTMDETGAYYENENACNDPFPCQFKPICFGPGADKICETGETPPNFKRIFTDLTVAGVALEE